MPIIGKLSEIQKRVINGSLDPRETLENLIRIADGKEPIPTATPPAQLVMDLDETIEAVIMRRIFDEIANISRQATMKSLDPFSAIVGNRLQMVIEKKGIISGKITTVNETPSWYIDANEQVKRLKQLNIEYNWGFEDSEFPPVPNFYPKKGDGLLILAPYLPEKYGMGGCQRTFDQQTAIISIDSSHNCRANMNSDEGSLKLLDNAPYRPGLRWGVLNFLANFDKYEGHKVEDLSCVGSDKTKLAASEILTAFMLFQWINFADQGVKFVNLAGYRLFDNGKWCNAPSWACRDYNYQNKKYREMSSRSIDSRGHYWTSPTFTEL